MFASRTSVAGKAGIVDVAFTDRHGGTSDPPFDSLHLGGPDAPDALANQRLVADALDVADLAVMRQVHGSEVVVLGARPGEPPICDALVTVTPQLALCVRAAD